MNLNTLLNVTLACCVIIWFGFFSVIAYQMLTGKINLQGVLQDKKDGSFSPGRLQLLVMTLLGVGQYLLMVFNNKNPHDFPEVPPELLLLIGGSNLFYLGGKSTFVLKDKLLTMLRD